MDRLSIKPINSDLINLIRFLAAQCVLVGHLDYYLFGHIKILNHVAKPMFGLFIILSGYLISITTYKKIEVIPNYGFKRFFIERIARIYTAFLPALLFCVFIDVVNHKYFGLKFDGNFNDVYDFKYWVINILQVQNHSAFSIVKMLGLVDIPLFTTMGTNAPLWSLSFEWWLYLFFGWWVLIKQKNKWWFTLVLLLLAITPVFRLFYPPKWIDSIVIMWLVGLVLSLLIRRGWHDKPSRSDKYLSVILLILSIVSCYYYKMTITVLLFGGWLFVMFRFLQHSDFKVNKRLSLFYRFGNNYSFTLYIIHYPLLCLAKNYIVNYNWKIILVLILTINVCAIVIAHFFETRYKKVSKLLMSKFL